MKKSSKSKKITKRKISKKIIRRKRNPEIDINKLKKGKYYILQEDVPSLVRPNYISFIFDHYGDEEIVGLNPGSFELIFREYDRISKIYGPFDSFDELTDYAYRLKPGKWLNSIWL